MPDLIPAVQLKTLQDRQLCAANPMRLDIDQGQRSKTRRKPNIEGVPAIASEMHVTEDQRPNAARGASDRIGPDRGTLGTAQQKHLQAVQDREVNQRVVAKD